MNEFVAHLENLPAPETSRYWIRKAAHYLAESSDPRHIMAAATCLAEAAQGAPEPLRRHLFSLKAELERRAFAT